MKFLFECNNNSDGMNRKNGFSLSLRSEKTNRTYKLNSPRLGIRFRKKGSPISHYLSSEKMICETGNGVAKFVGKEAGVVVGIKLNFSDARFPSIDYDVEISPGVVIEYLEYLSFDAPEGTKCAPVFKRALISRHIARLGQPVIAGDLFAGIASPVGDNGAEGGRAYFRYHLGRSAEELPDGYRLPSLVFGCAEGKSIEECFFDYVATFSTPKQCFQFNSWYDNMLDITPEKLENSFREMHQNLVAAGFDGLSRYVADDGWTEYLKPEFWEFNKKFPRGFEEVSALTKELRGSFGVWFGPRGGYTTDTPKYAKNLQKIGYHRNPLSNDVCTADKKYIADLVKKMSEFVEKYDVDYFKIDGFATRMCPMKGHRHLPGRGKGYAFYTEYWENWMHELKSLKQKYPELIVNITSYAHLSPWFLAVADYVWMNNASDIGFLGKGTSLDRMLTYRDGRYYELFYKRGYLFPAANIYNHEPCYALKNYDPADKENPVSFTDEEFRRYLKAALMRGSGLVELYFSPAMMDGKKWEITAKLLNWAKENFKELARSRIIGGDPEKEEPYGYFTPGGIFMLRNPSDSEKRYSFWAFGKEYSGTLKPFEIVFSE